MREEVRNCLVELAQKRGRDYITPADIEDAFLEFPEDEVRLATLHILGRTAGCGAEDAGCCAFVAWQGAEEARRNAD